MFGNSNSKPLASLSSGLLARKGQARPAMRPQGFVGVNSPLEDLGWNDMGGAVAPLDPQVAPPVAAPVPPVVRQREALALELTPEPAPEPKAPPAPEPVAAPAAPAETRAISNNTLARLGREAKAKTKKDKAAFTLRLDADRHLRLRLASAVRNRSAQQLVTEALDAFLNTVPEAEALARQLDAGTKR
ncbi:hypothetical protein [Sphingomonas baiyangensis]|uniref:Uncharacterized protein n=1 Tax=Sphingomonas baiyangensis TaxID=2572576 RepID=A0A4U1L0I4_9SPHN|nr:hypothetical protein [Sphingomonas baiyangensis]TKD50074.1 hypothetical protein FBR43_04360 [Sphingomonas baiyangensis]